MGPFRDYPVFFVCFIPFLHGAISWSIMSLHVGVLSPRCARVQQRHLVLDRSSHKGPYRQSRYKLVRYCAWKGKNGMWAAEIKNAKGRRETLGYYKTAHDASLARKKYFDWVQERRRSNRATGAKAFRGTKLPALNLSPRGGQWQKDTTRLPPQNNRLFRKYHAIRDTNGKAVAGAREVNPITKAHQDRLDRAKARFKKRESNEVEYHPLFRRSTNDINIDLMEAQDRLERTKELDQSFKTDSRYFNYVQNQSHYNIWNPLELKKGSETYRELKMRRKKSRRIVHPMTSREDGRSPTPISRWPMGCNNIDQNLDLEKFRKYN